MSHIPLKDLGNDHFIVFPMQSMHDDEDHDSLQVCKQQKCCLCRAFSAQNFSIEGLPVFKMSFSNIGVSRTFLENLLALTLASTVVYKI
jgi:hypothetical protein